MISMNKVMLIGRLGKDPELRETKNGTKVCNFSVATTESYKDKKTGEYVNNTEWHNIVVWGALAEVCSKFLKKGAEVLVEGKMQTRQYEKKDGSKAYTTEVVVQSQAGGKVQFGSKASAEGGDSKPAGKSASAAPVDNTPDSEVPEIDTGFDSDDFGFE